jgi:hypothetical protein
MTSLGLEPATFQLVAYSVVMAVTNEDKQMKLG